MLTSGALLPISHGRAGSGLNWGVMSSPTHIGASEALSCFTIQTVVCQSLFPVDPSLCF